MLEKFPQHGSFEVACACDSVAVFVLGGCPRIESLLRKNGFWPISPIKLAKYSKYSPH